MYEAIFAIEARKRQSESEKENSRSDKTNWRYAQHWQELYVLEEKKSEYEAMRVFTIPLLFRSNRVKAEGKSLFSRYSNYENGRERYFSYHFCS
jgi:hypothetical protein